MSLLARTKGFTNQYGAIVRGTKTEEYRDQKTDRLLWRVTTDVASAKTVGSEQYLYDADGHVTNTIFLDGTQTASTYDCCHLQSATDWKGVTTSYVFDALGRETHALRDEITTWTEYNANGEIIKVHRIGSDQSDIVTSQSTYNSKGELTSATDSLGHTTYFTNWVDGSGQTVRMTTAPDSGTRIETYAQDGKLVSVTGTAVANVRYEYGVESIDGAYREFTKETKLNGDGTDTAEWTKTWKDGAGREFRTMYADSTVMNHFFSGDRVTKRVDADGITTLMQYGPWGDVEVQAIDINQNGTIDTNGTDRVVFRIHDIATNGTAIVTRDRVLICNTTNSGNQVLIETSMSAVDGLTRWDVKNGVTNQTTTTLAGNGAWTETTTTQEGTTIVKTYQADRLTSLSVSNPGHSVRQESYEYDAHNRLWKQTDSRNGTTTLTYNDADQVISIATPAPSLGGVSQVTSNIYDAAGRLWILVQPDATAVTNEYYLTGMVKKTWGSRTYPVEYSYDYAGRLKTLKTWKDFSTDSGTAVTTWNYNNRGWLTNKVYADGQGPSYDYTSAGRLKTRVWARGVASTNSYNTAGDLTSIAYSDATPRVTINRDRVGRPTSIQGAATNILSYTGYGQLASEEIRNGTVNYLSQIRYGYNANAQVAGLTNQTIGYVQSFSYDGADLASLTSDSRQADYGYLEGSALIGSVTVKQGGSTAFQSTRTYDNLNRLTQISDSTSRFLAEYEYNSANQRTGRLDADGSFWNFGYDALGQVTNGSRFWSNSAPVAGQQFKYTFDDIGNRTGSRAGGDESGNNMRSATYNANMVNQITNRTVPGFVEVNGSTTNAVDVLVAGGVPVWQGNYFRKEVSIDNAATSVFTNVPMVVTDSGSTSSVARVAFVPQTPESFQYDADGNLVRDGQWAYTWDAENRLIGMQTLTNAIPAERRLKLDFTYDFQGRRLTKAVSRLNSNNGQWQLVSRKKFFYDGWNLIGEHDEVTGTRITYTWGLDISQTRQGAGGVGGLLWLTVYTGNIGTSYAAAYDGNGNVIGLVNTATGSTGAQYEYGPFGELLRATGPVGKINPFRFSSKYQDDETGLAYYGFRYYKPSTGSWVSRDSIAEDGGLPLYGFTGNAPVSRIDRDGNSYNFFYEETSIQSIRSRFPGTRAYTGNPHTAGFSTLQPRFGTQNVIKEDECCAWIEKAIELDLDVLTVMPNDIENVKFFEVKEDFYGKRMTNWWGYTSTGVSAMRGHEQRRRDIYKTAYYHFIAPVTADNSENGPLVYAGKKLCRTAPGEAKRLLENFLRRNQLLGEIWFTLWTQREQGRLGATEDNTFWSQNAAGLFTGLPTAHTYNIPTPPQVQWLPFPQ